MENGRDIRGRGGLPTARGGGGSRFSPFGAPRSETAGKGGERNPLSTAGVSLEPKSGISPDPKSSVSLDTKSVRRCEAGCDSAGERRILYSIPLMGPVDDRWRRSFRLTQIEDTEFFRYRLEMERDTISFTCSERNARAHFAAGLRQLDLLVARVNQKVASLD